MARILVTGSTTGIGLETARTLQGSATTSCGTHAARSGRPTWAAMPRWSSGTSPRYGRRGSWPARRACDVVIHNAGINWENERRETATASSGSSRSTCSRPTC